MPPSQPDNLRWWPTMWKDLTCLLETTRHHRPSRESLETLSETLQIYVPPFASLFTKADLKSPKNQQAQQDLDAGKPLSIGDSNLPSLPKESKESILHIATSLSIDFVEAAGWYLTGQDYASRLDRSPSEAAQVCCWEERLQRARALSLLLWTVARHPVAEVRDVAKSTVTSILQADWIPKIINHIKSDPPSDSAPEQTKELFHQVYRRREAQLLGHALYWAGVGQILGGDGILILVDHLAKAQGRSQECIFLISAIMAGLDAPSDRPLHSHSNQDSLDSSSSFGRSLGLGQAGRDVAEDASLIERLSKVLFPGPNVIPWRDEGMRGLLAIQLILAITRATDRHPALARRMGWKDETANRIFTLSVRSGAMLYARDHLVRAVRGEPIMGTTSLRYTSIEEFRKHREDQDMVLDQLEPFLQRIVYYLTEPLRYLKQQGEMSLEEAHVFLGTGDDKSSKDKEKAIGDAPGIDGVFDLIAAVYRDRGDAGSAWWGAERAAGFLEWSTQSRTPHILAACLRMLTALAGGQRGAAGAASFMQHRIGIRHVPGQAREESGGRNMAPTSGPRPSLCTWPHLFAVLRSYTAEGAWIGGRRMADSEATVLSPFLDLLYAVAKGSQEARREVVETKDWQALDRLFGLVGSSGVPRALKASALWALSALTGGQDPRVNQRIWKGQNSLGSPRTMDDQTQDELVLLQGTERDLRTSLEIWLLLEKSQMVPTSTPSLDVEGGAFAAELDEAEVREGRHEEARAFTALLLSLIYPSGIQGKESPSVPLSLGSGRRLPSQVRSGVTPYIKFVIRHILLRARTRHHVRAGERWLIVGQAVSLLERCVTTLDLSEYTRALSTKDSGESLSMDGLWKVALNPGHAILTMILGGEALLDELLLLVQLAMRVEVKQDTYSQTGTKAAGNNEDEEGEEEGQMRKWMLGRILSFFTQVLQVQSIYLEGFIPHLLSVTSQASSLTGLAFSTAPSSIMGERQEGVGPDPSPSTSLAWALPGPLDRLETLWATTPEALVSVALAIRLDGADGVGKHAVRLLRALARAGGQGSHRLAIVLEASGYARRIRYGVMDALDRPGLLRGLLAEEGDGISTGLEDVEIEAGREASQVAMGILRLLMDGVEDGTNTAHFFLGLNLTQAHTSSPSLLDQGGSCLGALSRLMQGSGGQELTEMAHSLVLSLLTSSRTARPLSPLLGEWVLQGLEEAMEGGEKAGEGDDGDRRALALRVYQQAWLLKASSVLLISGLADPTTEKALAKRMGGWDPRVLSFLGMVHPAEEAAASPSPLLGWALPPVVEACEGQDDRGCPRLNLDLLYHTLTTAPHSTLIRGVEDSNPWATALSPSGGGIRAGMRLGFTHNRQRALYHSAYTLVESWSQAVQAALARGKTLGITAEAGEKEGEVIQALCTRSVQWAGRGDLPVRVVESLASLTLVSSTHPILQGREEVVAEVLSVYASGRGGIGEGIQARGYLAGALLALLGHEDIRSGVMGGDWGIGTGSGPLQAVLRQAAQDALESGGEEWMILGTSLLNALLLQEECGNGQGDGGSHIIQDQLVRWQALRALIHQVRSLDTFLLSYLATQRTSQTAGDGSILGQGKVEEEGEEEVNRRQLGEKAVHLYLGRLSLFSTMASTRKGSMALMEAGLLEALGDMSFLSLGGRRDPREGGDGRLSPTYLHLMDRTLRLVRLLLTGTTAWETDLSLEGIEDGPEERDGTSRGWGEEGGGIKDRVCTLMSTHQEGLIRVDREVCGRGGTRLGGLRVLEHIMGILAGCVDDRVQRLPASLNSLPLQVLTHFGGQGWSDTLVPEVNERGLEKVSNGPVGTSPLRRRAGVVVNRMLRHALFFTEKSIGVQGNFGFPGVLTRPLITPVLNSSEPSKDSFSLSHLVLITKNAFSDLSCDTLTYEDLQQILKDPTRASSSKVKELLMLYWMEDEEGEGAQAELGKELQDKLSKMEEMGPGTLREGVNEMRTRFLPALTKRIEVALGMVEASTLLFTQHLFYYLETSSSTSGSLTTSLGAEEGGNGMGGAMTRSMFNATVYRSKATLGPEKSRVRLPPSVMVSLRNTASILVDDWIKKVRQITWESLPPGMGEDRPSGHGGGVGREEFIQVLLQHLRSVLYQQNGTSLADQGGGGLLGSISLGSAY
ncbi:hypothetical protein BJ684DRAFT_19024 [Piptocephalis cylindrospora]|uniref:Uncharacterized protein n=1 Tax=Piptocephalis cylindrospora TaxID=1907219 RepID=A0A4P9Y8C7_9FUNG|nr:hypothetical protein BJ684DRAFT_19024 [Piptocephalis cylindrospora]|eukprot:RKP14581.1 hypothetical protein BJ684DRAFT_19024 [Piptocephalis cylindrospora]